MLVLVGDFPKMKTVASSHLNFISAWFALLKSVQVLSVLRFETCFRRLTLSPKVKLCRFGKIANAIIVETVEQVFF